MVCYLYQSDHLFVVVFLLISVFWQYLLIEVVLDNIVVLATHAIILGINKYQTKFYFSVNKY